MATIIGLIGGKPSDREEIANRLERFGRRAIVEYRAAPGTREGARLRELGVMLERIGQGGSLVVTHVVHQSEAEMIRRRGGVIWYVMGLPSESVRIERGDLPVTHMQGGCRHYLDPLEALTETLLQRAAAY